MPRRSSKIISEDVILPNNEVNNAVPSAVKGKIEVKRSSNRIIPKKVVRLKKIKNLEYNDEFEEEVAEKVMEKYIKPRLNSLEIYEKQERKKILMMWIGVGVFMFIIAAYWMYDISRVFQQSRLEYKGKNDFSFEKLGEATENVSTSIDEFKQQLEKAKTILATTSQESVATTTEVPKPELNVKELQEKLMASSSGEVKGVVDSGVINELKNKLPAVVDTMAGKENK